MTKKLKELNLFVDIERFNLYWGSTSLIINDIIKELSYIEDNSYFRYTVYLNTLTTNTRVKTRWIFWIHNINRSWHNSCPLLFASFVLYSKSRLTSIFFNMKFSDNKFLTSIDEWISFIHHSSVMKKIYLFSIQWMKRICGLLKTTKNL